ncbi:MAG: HAD family phosphatase [Bacillales bacterium]|nr:HAD family phosphatase [Bacillales bacterium]
MRFVFDLDGTICFKGAPVSENLLACFGQLEKEGHEIIFASARPIRDMLPVLHERFYKHTLIGGNGSLISKDGKVIFSNAFTDEQVEKILFIIEKQNATYLIDSDWDYAYTGPSDHPILKNVDVNKLAKSVSVNDLNSIVKILILTMDNYDDFVTELKPLNVVAHRHSNENTIDISPKNIDKWNALKKLGIEDHSYVAFGNDSNDLSMFQHSIHSVMIGDHKELAKYADERIQLDENCETNIIRKLMEIAEQYKHSI